jgi:hypothetical protein
MSLLLSLQEVVVVTFSSISFTFFNLLVVVFLEMILFKMLSLRLTYN